MNKIAVIAISILVTIGAVFSVVAYLASLGKGFTPQTDHLVFVRDVRKDGGTSLKPENIISTDGSNTHLTETEVFSPERISRIQEGRGLLVDFFTMNGSQQISHETLKVTGWDKYEEIAGHVITSEDMLNKVGEERKKFGEAVAKFTGPVSISATFGIVVDTTEGVSQELRKRVHEVIQELGAVDLAKKGHSVKLNMYHITESSYQGGRRKIRLKPSNIAEAEQWLLSGTEQSSSSVLRGLRSIIHETSEIGGNPSLYIFTDGLENLQEPELSVYRQPELLKEENWGKIDEVAHFENLKLKGIQIHLYPLPPNNSRHEDMMGKGLAYLKDRLTKAGATVELEPF